MNSVVDVCTPTPDIWKHLHGPRRLGLYHPAWTVGQRGLAGMFGPISVWSCVVMFDLDHDQKEQEEVAREAL